MRYSYEDLQERIEELEAEAAKWKKAYQELYSKMLDLYGEALALGQSYGERSQREQGDGDGSGAGAAVQGTLPLVEADSEGVQLWLESADR